MGEYAYLNARRDHPVDGIPTSSANPDDLDPGLTERVVVGGRARERDAGRGGDPRVQGLAEGEEGSGGDGTGREVGGKGAEGSRARASPQRGRVSDDRGSRHGESHGSMCGM